jgi:hypothetical protein
VREKGSIDFGRKSRRHKTSSAQADFEDDVCAELGVVTSPGNGRLAGRRRQPSGGAGAAGRRRGGGRPAGRRPGPARARPELRGGGAVRGAAAHVLA